MYKQPSLYSSKFQGVRFVDSRVRVLEHGVPGTDRPAEEHSAGPLQVQVLHLQAEAGGGVHPVQQEELLRGVPRDVRSGSRVVHEDGGEGDGQRDALRSAHGLLRRSHAPRSRAHSQE